MLSTKIYLRVVCEGKHNVLLPSSNELISDIWEQGFKLQKAIMN